jgi:transposase
MLSGVGPSRVYLACGSTDMRKSIDSLAAIVSLTFELDVFSESWFVFCNRGRDKLKILHWDTNGFWLYYRRLERGRFRWPEAGDGETISITRRQLDWLLSGLSIEQAQAHREMTGRKVA